MDTRTYAQALPAARKKTGETQETSSEWCSGPTAAWVRPCHPVPSASTLVWFIHGGRGGLDLADPPPGHTTPPPKTKQIFPWGKMKF